ncbi:lantibiotic dehydratase [Microbispora tritici]|uniref:Lantibiotic dehydratase n=1 Tax=Microbispora tritici TaxID=2604471 RepID=A0ABY3LSK3_9ACTN|nr:lantibiotic dehydratase [Microbispora tritici]
MAAAPPAPRRARPVPADPHESIRPASLPRGAGSLLSEVRVPDTPCFRASGVALVRAAAHTDLGLPPWPDLTGRAPERLREWCDWLDQVWSLPVVADALDHAAPSLAEQVRALLAASNPSPDKARRCVLSVARYLLRMTGRATPLGLIAGVAPAAMAAAGETAGLRWGSRHQAIARAGADWLAAVIHQLEICHELLLRLPVVTNSAVLVRGDRLIVPYQPNPDRGGGAVEVSLRYTTAVAVALDAARAPIRLEDLVAKIAPDFPTTNPATVTGMLNELVARRALVTSLHAPSTVPDALDYLLQELDTADAQTIPAAAALVGGLREIHDLLHAHTQAPLAQSLMLREEAAAQMRAIAPSRRHPVAVDLRLDADLVLPREVVAEVERAALVLSRLSAYPYGTPAWRAYHERFFDHFGIGSSVPLADVVADSGIGWPEGYPGTGTEEPRSPMSHRDQMLLALAQRAALDGAGEITVTDAMIAALELGPQVPRVPPHLELGVRVYATSVEAFREGRVRVEVVTVSRSAGTLIGRFLPVLDSGDSARLTAALADMPSGGPGTVCVQVSFPPLDPATAHVARSAQVLPTVISLAEHRAPGWNVLTPDDLAVACDGRRLVLTAPAPGIRVHATAMHALALGTPTPPLARLLSELSRAPYAQVTTFSWGAAAHLPYLPRIRYGRIILSPARWRLDAADLPAPREEWSTWDDAWAGLRQRLRVPRLVHLVHGDQRLPLDLDHSGHRVLLRTHLNRDRDAILAEAPTPEDTAWCGGRAHEVIIPLAATGTPEWPRMPTPSRARTLPRGHGDAPAASTVLMASLYGAVQRQDVILAEYLPTLLRRLGNPSWWFVRYRDPGPHLRLRITLPAREAFGAVAGTVSDWADDLHRIGLLRELRYCTSYPEIGRWGDGPAMTAAEHVFTADSRAVLAQLRQPARPDRQALAAAHAVAIAAAWTGSTEAGMRWLIEHVAPAAPGKVSRPVFTEAVRIANPGDNWAGLRGAPGGDAIAAAWADRAIAVADYRTHLPGPHTQGVDPDNVLVSLLHVNYIRVCRIDPADEAECMYLARSAALAWTVRITKGGHP